MFSYNTKLEYMNHNGDGTLLVFFYIHTFHLDVKKL